ncbi:Metallo-hydrolase/oxidoreductase [Corynespora cassiicola Philippines]|uniref:Metallo-hydrolase/oxidoreductase n=1 Tax=Corynespora cassiicola Philippines TaxID=1448308 RepID=A0A2T2NPW4_CORCC|nr:Metallo-hydrolase/oxidoreductase [Corynespora cassiicola Philippines]
MPVAGQGLMFASLTRCCPRTSQPLSSSFATLTTASRKRASTTTVRASEIFHSSLLSTQRLLSASKASKHSASASAKRNHSSSASSSKTRFWRTPRFSSSATVRMSSITATAAGIGSAGLYAVVSNPAQVGAQPEDAADKKHHLKCGKGFTNPWDSFTELTTWQISKMMMGRRFSGQAHNPDTSLCTVPTQTPSFLTSRSTPKLRATWLGHACYYVEFPSGFRVLFDPVFEDCCSPINLKFLKRYTPPPCEIEDLPVVDAVVISHNHYDHLSYPTIQRIQKRFPDAHFFAPLGNKKWFLASGVQNVTELDWWESRDVTLTKNGEKAEVGTGSADTEGSIRATIGALPCQHVSARTPFDKCQTLWASWSVESGGAKVWFAGDTGYRSVPAVPKGTDDYGPDYAHLPHCPAFAQIGEHRGPFDLGLIPIGAYEPRFVMSPMHANPKDSVNIFVDTKCKKALGMHWGTWVLTEEDVMEPPRKLEEALEWKGVEKGRFGVVGLGESKEFESGEKA